MIQEWRHGGTENRHVFIRRETLIFLFFSFPFLRRKTNIFDNVVYMMEKYADNLEELVIERTGQLIEEKKKTDALLERMLPR